jgi:diamine N-acetyltransferase
MMEGGEAVVSIVGERVALGPLRRELADQLYGWFNDFHIARTQGDTPGPRTREQVEAWYARRTARDATSTWFTIYARATGEPLGITWLAEIDFRHRTAGFGISIGAPAARGQGYGTETTRLMLDYAFTALGLHNVSLEVYSNNLAGVRAYEKAGFRVCGRRHECYRLGPHLYDELHMECLATWFDRSHAVLGTVFAPDTPRAG